MNGPPPARSFANLILMIGLGSAGLATFMALGGNSTQGLYVCGGGAVLAGIILLVGGLVVASNRRGEE